jgi:hypothetical protein
VADDFALNYHNVPVGDMFARPVRCRIQATFSNSGATITVDTAGRKSQVGATITGSAGSYSVAGLPRGAAYHVVGINMLNAGATPTVFLPEVTSFSASAGTLTFRTRQINYDGSQAGAAVATGSDAAPANSSQIHITLDIETGVYS